MAQEGKTLDLRPLPPRERHEKIFALWEHLEPGESLRIINDHNPKPLYYVFTNEHPGEFEWTWEEQGPQDWVFRIKKVAPAEKEKEALKTLLKKLHSGGDVAQIKEQAKAFLGNLDATRLALLEQEIIQEGVSREEMRQLCDVHLEILREALSEAKPDLPPGHPVHTLMEEHQVIKSYLAALGEILERATSAESLHRERETLQHIAQHLLEADKHHQREEEALFPPLQEHGVTEPPAIMLLEHEELKARKKRLLELSRDEGSVPSPEWQKELKEAGDYLVKELPSHIYKEDNILYPLALQTLSAEEWAVVKERCDRIGYCCFTPSR